tara:strand:+ start:386 stop:523 length:138 start_codon:yes stop_codon:yes gene_type:complete
MEILNKEKKEIYNIVMSIVKFEKVDSSDIEIPKDWIDETKRAKLL